MLLLTLTAREGPLSSRRQRFAHLANCRATPQIAARGHSRVPRRRYRRSPQRQNRRKRRSFKAALTLHQLLTGDRRSTATASRPGIPSAPPPQTPACRLGTIEAGPVLKSPTQRAFGADDIAAYPRRKRPHDCGVDDDAGFPILFPEWVTSRKQRSHPRRKERNTLHAALPSQLDCVLGFRHQRQG